MFSEMPAQVFPSQRAHDFYLHAIGQHWVIFLNLASMAEKDEGEESIIWLLSGQFAVSTTVVSISFLIFKNNYKK